MFRVIKIKISKPKTQIKWQENWVFNVSTKFIEPSEVGDLEIFQYKIERLQEKFPDKILAGGYLEPRALYTTDKYGKSGNSGMSKTPKQPCIFLFWIS